MATHPSAEKRHTQSLKRQARNKAAKSTIWTSVKQVIKTCEEKNFDQADTAFRATSSLLSKAASKGIIHKKKAQRRISRLQQRVNAAKALA